MKMKIKNIHKKKLSRASNAYQALFLIEGLKSRLIRSPVEINNNNNIRMWRDCFDDAGRFDRARFNRYRQDLDRWDKAFYVIWLDLKSVVHKEDRTAIINCLMRIIKDSTQVDRYVDFILKDFFYYPLHLHYSDMNALIFVNMLLFRSCAIRDYDFERTPEEVLIASDEKNAELIERLSGLITSQWGDRFLEKIRTIRRNLYLALEPKDGETATLPADTLINLVREVFIFLALVGGSTAYKITREIVDEFADPTSRIYNSKDSPQYLKALLQLLQLLTRCLIELGDDNDIELLRLIKMRKKDFLAKKSLVNLDLSLHQKVVKKIISVADEGIGTLMRKEKREQVDYSNYRDSSLDKTFVLD